MDMLFSDEDRQRIAAAIKVAEAETSGELVPYIVPRCAPYEAVPWRAGVLSALLMLAVLALARTLPLGLPAPLTSEGAVLLLVLFVGGLGAFVAASVPGLVRRFAGADRMEAAVHQRALQAFVEEEVFATRDRTGVLLFVSLLERRIEVVADAGVYQAVDAAAWADVTARVRHGIEADALARGLIDGIEACGTLLREHGFHAPSDDPDELPSRLRVDDE
jgi:putative membrane protein